MRHSFVATMLTGAFLGAAAIGQSIGPTDPTVQPPAAQTTPQSSQAPTAARTQAPQTSLPTIAPPDATASHNSEAISPTRLAPGSVIPVQLTKTIDAKKAKTGDQVVARVTKDMRSTSGQVVIAKDTKIIGHVTEADPRSKEQKESRLALAFDHAVTKDGQEMQMPMSIQAVIGQENNQNAVGDNQGGSGNSEESGTTNPSTMRSPMSGSPHPAPPSGLPPSADNGEGAPRSAARPPINARTQGVIGISNLSLQAANGNQGSLLTSEKNNVKLESGTMLLLTVNQ